MSHYPVRARPWSGLDKTGRYLILKGARGYRQEGQLPDADTTRARHTPRDSERGMAFII